MLATTYLAHPEFYHLGEWNVMIAMTGLSQERTKVDPSGRKIQAIAQVDAARFYAYILRQWAR